MPSHHILVVDDDFLVRSHAVESLEKAGFRVVEAFGTAAGLAALKDNPGIKLVCTDVNMPGELNGMDLAMSVRAHHGTWR
ncbi:response regulator [Phenylobacterium montanum]